MAVRSGFAVSIVWAAAAPLVWSQSVSSFETTLILLFSAPSPLSIPFTRSSRAGTPGTPSRIPSVSPAFSLPASHFPASTPPFRLFVATTDVFLVHEGRSLSISTTLTPALTARFNAGITAALVGVIAIPFTPLATMSWIAAISPASSVADLPWA